MTTRSRYALTLKVSNEELMASGYPTTARVLSDIAQALSARHRPLSTAQARTLARALETWAEDPSTPFRHDHDDVSIQVRRMAPL